MTHIPRLQGPTLANVSFTAVPIKFADQHHDVWEPCRQDDADKWEIFGNDESLCLVDTHVEVREMFATLERLSSTATVEGFTEWRHDS